MRCPNHRPCTGAASTFGGDSSPHASCAFGLEPEEAFKPIQRIGGSTGWYAANWFWRLRGLLDTLRGGVGLRRGRRDPQDLRDGDTVDFWRVERLEKGRLMRLVAEMKIPGRLWLAVRSRSRRP